VRIPWYFEKASFDAPAPLMTTGDRTTANAVARIDSIAIP
jgi:hypothetical protein